LGRKGRGDLGAGLVGDPSIDLGGGFACLARGLNSHLLQFSRRRVAAHGTAGRMMSITRILIESTSTTLPSTVAYLRYWAKSKSAASSGSASNGAECGTGAPTTNGISATGVPSRRRDTAL